METSRHKNHTFAQGKPPNLKGYKILVFLLNVTCNSLKVGSLAGRRPKFLPIVLVANLIGTTPHQVESESGSSNADDDESRSSSASEGVRPAPGAPGDGS